MQRQRHDGVDADAVLPPRHAPIGHALAQDDLGARGDGRVGRGQRAVHPLDVSATVKDAQLVKVMMMLR